MAMRDPYGKVLVGIEVQNASEGTSLKPTADSEAAFLRALDLARAHGSSLHLIHVLDMDPLARAWAERQGEGSGTWVGESKAALAKLARTAAEAGVEVSTSLQYGKPADTLARIAAEEKIDLVVVGARRPSGAMTVYALRGVLLGTTASRVIHECPSAVWVVRPNAPRPYARIVVATDLSPLGERTLEHAARLAQREGAKLHVVHAIDTWFARQAWYFRPSDASIRRDLEAQLTEARSKLAYQLANTVERVGLTTQTLTHLEIMAPEELILRVARLENADLVVLGTRARHGLAGFFVGNTCERILPELNCALFVGR